MVTSMGTTSIHCPVLGAAVACVSDLEGHVSRVICSEYEEPGLCRLKKQVSRGGPLSQLLDRVAENSLQTRSTVCVMLAGVAER